MTNSNISKVAAGYQTQGLPKGNVESARKTESSGDTFSAMIGQMNLGLGQSVNLSGKQENPISAGISKAGNVSGGGTQDYTSKSDAVRIKKAQDTGSSVKEKAEALEETTGEKIRDVMEEELGVTEEELEEVLEKLGFGLMDLLNQANLAQAVSELTGTETSSLLLSEDFVNVMQAVNEIAAELAAELGISQEELQSMISEAVGQTGELELSGEEMPQAAGEAPDADETQNPEFSEQSGDEALQAAKTDAPTEKADEADAEENADSRKVSVEQQNSQGEQKEINSDVGEDSRESTTFIRQEAKGTEHAVVETNGSQAFMQGQTAEVNVTPAVPVYTGDVNVSEILQQIAEFVKVSVSQDVSSLEMQLNPENLGKLYLQISATKEGSITAQFAAQNEAVKEALETQIVELKQTLNQQGVKVDAIEVTVASHEFEKNLEQNAEREKQQGQQEEQRQGRRNLNLNQLDGLSGLMSEEEMLAAKIMQENGNSMDVTA